MAYRTTRARYERRDFRFLMFASSASTEARVNGASAKTSTVNERQSPSLSTNEPTATWASSSAFVPRSGFRGSSILARRRTGHANGASSTSSRLWFFRPKPGFGARLGRAESADRAALDGTSEPSTTGGPRVSELDVPRSRPPSSTTPPTPPRPRRRRRRRTRRDEPRRGRRRRRLGGRSRATTRPTRARALRLPSRRSARLPRLRLRSAGGSGAARTPAPPRARPPCRARRAWRTDDRFERVGRMIRVVTGPGALSGETIS